MFDNAAQEYIFMVLWGEAIVFSISWTLHLQLPTFDTNWRS